jgi:hypothetical protein
MPFPPDGATFKNISATTAAFELQGGTYGVFVTATWGGGNVALNGVGPDGSTLAPVMTALTANGYASVVIPAGMYKFAVTTATAVYASVYRVPLQ